MNGNAWIKFTNELSIQMGTTAAAMKTRSLYFEFQGTQTNQLDGKTTKNGKCEL